MSEAAVLRAITDFLLYKGALVLRINSGAAIAATPTGGRRFLSFVRWSALGVDEHRAGCSDLIAIFANKVFMIEVKAPGRRSNVSQAQALFLAEAEARGAVCVVATCIEDVEAALE